MGDTRDFLTEPMRHFYTMSSDEPTSYGLASIHVFREQGDRMAYKDCLFQSFLRSALSTQGFPKTCSEQVAHINLLPPSLSWEQLWLCLTSALDLMMSCICTVSWESWDVA